MVITTNLIYTYGLYVHMGSHVFAHLINHYQKVSVFRRKQISKVLVISSKRLAVAVTYQTIYYKVDLKVVYAPNDLFLVNNFY